MPIDDVIKKGKINDPSLKKLIVNITGKELAKLSEPCYYPSLKKYYFELLHETNLTENDIKKFVKDFYKDLPASKWALQTDPITNFLIILMYYFLKNKDYISFQYTLLFMGIRNYANILNKQMKFCKEEHFKYAIQHLNRTHLFVREGSIGNGIYYLSKELAKRYNSKILEGNPEGISEFITEYRHRISQSLKSFAEEYYRASESGMGIKTQIEYEDEEGNINLHQEKGGEKGSELINNITKKIAIYKYVDKKAQIEAQKLTKINYSLSNLLINNLNDIKYSDKIHNILRLFVKDLSSTKEVCGDQFYPFVKKLMGTKSIKINSFRGSINILLLNLIEDIGFKEEYDNLGIQTKKLISDFLAYYITMVLRNTLCFK